MNVIVVNRLEEPQIPKLLHIIWLKEGSHAIVPEYVAHHIEQWRRLMPHWKLMFWNDESLQNGQFSKHVIDAIHKAKTGAQKADILRYHVVEMFGGFYVDADVVPIMDLTGLLYLHEDLLLYHDNHVTWAYLINCFFGAKAHHPVLKLACERVLQATLNTEDVHLQTGPALWGQCVQEMSTKSETPFLVLASHFFNKHEASRQRLGIHLYKSTWTRDTILNV
jgi:mannosyltransferase OCH1-like enzyme